MNGSRKGTTGSREKIFLSWFAQNSRCRAASRSPIAMRQPSPPENANETQESEKVSFLVVKRIREAILDEVFSPAITWGGRTGGEI